MDVSFHIQEGFKNKSTKAKTGGRVYLPKSFFFVMLLYFLLMVWGGVYLYTN